MSVIRDIRSVLTEARDRKHSLKDGSIVLGRCQGSVFVSGRRVTLTPKQIADGVTVTGTTGSGIIEAARLITSRLLDSGRRVVLLSDNESMSLFKYFFDLTHSYTSQFISIDDGCLIHPGTKALHPTMKNALCRSWHDSEFIGVNFPGHRKPASETYLRDMVSFVKTRWPDRVVVFVGYASGQTGPIDTLNDTIMMFNAPVEPERLKGLSRSDGAFIKMRSEWDGETMDVSSLNAGDGLISDGAGSTQQFRFDYLPIMDYGLVTNLPIVIIPGSEGNAMADLSKMMDREEPSHT